MALIIGIDPGINGGIVAINTKGKIVSIDNMPKSNSELISLIKAIGPRENEFFIEKVHAMPTDGAVSAFTFGKHIGGWEMLFTFLGITPKLVTPQQWQTFFGLSRDIDEVKYAYKKRLLVTAKKKANKKNQITLKTCDAFLIALYGLKQKEIDDVKKTI